MKNLSFICVLVVLGFNLSALAVSPENIPFSLDNKELENTSDYSDSSTEQLLFSVNSKTVKFVESKNSKESDNSLKKANTELSNDPNLIIRENSLDKSPSISSVNLNYINAEIKNSDNSTVKIEHGDLDHPPKTDTLIKVDDNLQIISDSEIKKLKKTVLAKSIDGSYKNTDDKKNSEITLQNLNAEKRRLELERKKLIQFNSSSSTVLTKKDFLFK